MEMENGVDTDREMIRTVSRKRRREDTDREMIRTVSGKRRREDTDKEMMTKSRKRQ